MANKNHTNGFRIFAVESKKNLATNNKLSTRTDSGIRVFKILIKSLSPDSYTSILIDKRSKISMKYICIYLISIRKVAG